MIKLYILVILFGLAEFICGMLFMYFFIKNRLDNSLKRIIKGLTELSDEQLKQAEEILKK